MKKEIDYTGQIFGTRKIVQNYCDKKDWELIKREVPKASSKYRLSECLICGARIPVLMKNIIQTPPKQCPFCSPYGHKNMDISTNIWSIDGDVSSCSIQYKNTYIVCYIDTDDYERASSRVWRISKKKNKYYVVSGNIRDNTYIYLHTFILNSDIADGYEIDHKDGNSLNNRRSNLRVVTRIENIQNSNARIDNKIGIRGIVKSRNVYKCDFSFDNARYYFKDWPTIEQAVYCRKYAEEYFGLEILNRNPLAQKYLVLDEAEADDIKKYVNSVISRK